MKKERFRLAHEQEALQVRAEERKRRKERGAARQKQSEEGTVKSEVKYEQQEQERKLLAEKQDAERRLLNEAQLLEKLKEHGWLRLNLPSPYLPFADGFLTPSGKLEFNSGQAAATGLDPIPGYTPPGEVADDALAERYPLALVAPASHYFLNSIFESTCITQ